MQPDSEKLIQSHLEIGQSFLEIGQSHLEIGQSQGEFEQSYLKIGVKSLKKSDTNAKQLSF